MANEYGIDVGAFDYLAGGAVAAQNEAIAAQANTSSLAAVGTTTQIIGFDGSGNPEAKSVAGDSNGVGLAFSGNTLQATLTQGLKTTSSPTFAALTLTAALTVGNGGTGATTAPAARTNLGIDAIATKKSNLAASVAPGVTDDGAAGYAVGSIWCDTTADDAYICLDSTNGAAVWKKVTP